MPRTSTTCFARSVGSPTTCSASFTVSRSARRKRAADSRSAAAGVGAEVGCTLVVALRSWSEVSPVSRSTTSRTSLSVARSTVALVAADSTVVLASGSRPRTSTRPARRWRSLSTLTEMMSPRPGSENHVSTCFGALA